MGRPQEMAILRAEAAWLRANTWAAHAHSGSPTTSLPRSLAPPWSCLTICTGSLGTCLGNGSPPCHPEDRAISMGHTSQQLSQLLTDSVRRKDLGTGGLGRGFSKGLSEGQASSLTR